METNSGEIITGLRNKMRRLVSLLEAEKEEKRMILLAHSELTKQLELNKGIIDELDKKYNTLKLAKTVEASSDDTTEAKQKIQRIVREIDNCIALLNR